MGTYKIPVFVCVYSHKHGDDVEVYPTHEAAQEMMAATILSFDWEFSRADESAPVDPVAAGWGNQQILDAYFGEENEHESYFIEERDIQVDLPEIDKLKADLAAVTAVAADRLAEIARLQKRVDTLTSQLAANQSTWEDEEDSVQAEHASLIEDNDAVLEDRPTLLNWSVIIAVEGVDVTADSEEDAKKRLEEDFGEFRANWNYEAGEAEKTDDDPQPDTETWDLEISGGNHDDEEAEETTWTGNFETTYIVRALTAEEAKEKALKAVAAADAEYVYIN